MVSVQRQVEAGHLADLWVERADEVSDEVVTALNRLSASDFPICSNEDLQLLRKEVFLSRFLRSASRIQDGQILCSSTTGRTVEPVRLPPPDFVTDYGNAIHLDVEVVGAPGVRAMYLSRKNASVSVRRDAYEVLADTRLQYVGVGRHDGRIYQFMSSRDLKLSPRPSDLESGKVFYSSGERYEVRCSALHSGCIVARLGATVPGLTAPVVSGFALFGLLAGLAIAYCLTFVRGRAVSTGRRLKRALRKNELKLVYQPIMRLTQRDIVGAEALLRWRDREGHDVDPALFIAVAEAEGFVSEITEFVLGSVLTEMGDYLRRTPSFQVTINVAPSDLANPTFPSLVARALAESRVPARSLGFEITERSTANRAAIAAGIRALRAEGHRIYIDDFGVEYSSLSYLSELVVDGIKLDKSFCQLVPDDERTKHISAQIVRLFALLRLDLVVEGIEHEAQFAYFAKFNLPIFGQGWLFSKPLPAAMLQERYPNTS